MFFLNKQYFDHHNYLSCNNQKYLFSTALANLWRVLHTYPP